MTRRELNFDNLSDALDECRRLLNSGYVRNGNWSLGQICRHIRITLAASMDGYPRWMSLAAPIRPILKWLMLSKLLEGKSPSGMKTLGIFVPPDDVDDQEELAMLEEMIARFKSHSGYLYPHPGFGKMEHAKLDHFHAAHTAHHLSFLADK